MSKPKLDYEFAPAGDAQLRCFVLECMADADIHAPILIQNMNAVVRWIKGEPPLQPRKVN